MCMKIHTERKRRKERKDMKRIIAVSQNIILISEKKETQLGKFQRFSPTDRKKWFNNRTAIESIEAVFRHQVIVSIKRIFLA